MNSNFQKIFLFFLFFLIFSTAFLTLNKSVLAQVAPEGLGTSYTQQELLPGQSKEEATGDFLVYLQYVYNFGIAIAIILAIFMIAMGGFNYMIGSAGNLFKMGDAKQMIIDAIIGLVIALIAYLILFVVNPDLVKGGITKFPNTGQMIKK